MYKFSKIGIGLLLFFTACATAQKGAPKIDTQAFPQAEFSALQPRTLQLQVKNRRKVNMKAGNTTEVEGAIQQALVTYFKQRGVSIDLISPNHLLIEVSDHGNFDQDGECVQIDETLVLGKKGTVSAKAIECNGMKRTAGITFGGNISDSYNRALSAVLEAMDRKVKDFGYGN